MLTFLTKSEKEDAQRRGYMCEHLISLYSIAVDRTALFNNNFPVYMSGYTEADVILFGLSNNDDQITCVKELANMPIKTLNIVSPEPLKTVNTELKYSVFDYHIDVNRFDVSLKGSSYKRLRYQVKRAQKNEYYTKLSRDFTPSHIYILARHMTRHKYDAWDFEELLSIERFLREHSHGLMMEVYKNDELLGFDIVDFFENNRIMAVPLGIYLKAPGLADLMMYENLKYAKENGYEWLDVGHDCGEAKLRRFKEKWFAEPKYKICVQTMNLNH